MAFLVTILLVSLVLTLTWTSGFAAQALAASSATRGTSTTGPQAHADHQLSAQPCPGARANASQASIRVLDSAVTCLINRERESWGLPRLTVNYHLDSAAQHWSGWMAAHGQFNHDRLAYRISAAGYDWEEIGENIATGYATPMEAVTAWMASPGHCQNILSPDWRNVGTGVVDKPVQNMASSGATWTQDFGLAMRQTSPSTRTRAENGCPYRV